MGARVYGAGARVYGVGARVYGSLVILVSAQDFRTLDFGLGLDNFMVWCFEDEMLGDSKFICSSFIEF